MKKNDFNNTLLLFKISLKRDRFRIPIWIFSLTLVFLMVVIGNSTFEPETMKDMARAAINNPGMRLLIAPANGEDLTNLGAFVHLRMSFLLFIVIGIMNIQLILRHTRKNEEDGIRELISSASTGKKSFILTGLLLSLISNIGVALGMCLVFLVNGLSLYGSLIVGISYGLLGMVFAGIATAFSELSSTSRGADGSSKLVLALAFLINSLANFLGDVSDQGLGFSGHSISWLTPLGWAQQVKPFGENNIFPLILLLTLAIALFIFSFIVVNLRDIGSGIIPAKLGRSEGKKWMLNPYGFSFRQSRTLLIGWSIPVLLFGALMGAAAQEFGDILKDNPLMARALVGGEQTFVYMMISVLISILCFFTLKAFLSSFAEESRGLAEGILATPTKRTTYISSHILISLLGTIVISLLFVITIIFTQGDLSFSKEFLLFSFQNLSGVILILGISVALYGLIPRFCTLFSWITLSVFIIAGPFVGTLIDLDQSIMDISPFSHFGFNYDWGNWPIAMVFYSLGVILTLIGVVRFNRRSMYTTN